MTPPDLATAALSAARIGAELKAAQERGEVATRADGAAIRDHVHVPDKVAPPTLNDLGIPRQRAAEMKKLATAARLVARLRPDWRDAASFYEARSAALEAVRAVARHRCPGCPAEALQARLSRSHALLRAVHAEVRRLRRLLATAARPRRRNGLKADARQGRLPV